MQIKEHFDILIIGAGASGLSAAYELSQQKCRILVVEAQDRIGGRMYTNLPQNFTSPIESGAEFIHGECPVTLELLKKANANYVAMDGITYHAYRDTIEQEDFFDDDWQRVLEHLNSLASDVTFADFLQHHFSGEKFQQLREKMKKFVEGYNAADIHKVSSFALREEWSQEEDAPQYRIEGGYAKLYNYLRKSAEDNGTHFRLGEKVTEIHWKTNTVEAHTASGKFTATKCIITIPVTLLRSGAIRFAPEIPTIIAAAEKVGFGGVVKINLEFRKKFWETEPNRKLKSIQFIFSDEVIPTWWSQSPDPRPLLTGWVGGPQAESLHYTNDEFLEIAITSLANAMDYAPTKIKEELVAWKVDQWIDNEFSNGAYSYERVGTPDAVKVLQQPLADTLYFAGETIYTGPFKSTVEAALTSGSAAARAITNR